MVRSKQQLTSSEESVDRALASDEPIGEWLRQLLAAVELRELFQALFQRELTDSALGLPRWADATQLRAHIRASDAWVELARSPRVEAFDAAVVLSGEHATELVDRLLGGSGQASVAGQYGAPSAAECGVLAYGAARLCALAGGWSVRDVRTAGELGALSAPCLLWPVALRTLRGDLDLMLVLSGSLAESIDRAHVLELVVRDVCAEQTLRELAPGDVLLSDRWTLTHTSDGLSGDVIGVVEGSDTELLLRLGARQLKSRGLAKPAAGDALELVLGRVGCRLLSLAELARGGSLPLEVSDQPVIVRRAGVPLAHGELIVHRGAIGVRVVSRLTP
jgi:hypothetical protein